MLINNTKATLQHINEITLKPGVNTVDSKKWLEARKHKSVKKKIDLGIIIEETEVEEIEDDNGEVTNDPAQKLSSAYSEEDYNFLHSLNVSQARNIIKETFDIKLLEEWVKREAKEKDRKQVAQALEKQIKLMNTELEERDRNQTRQIVTGRGPEIVELKANPSSIDD